MSWLGFCQLDTNSCKGPSKGGKNPLSPEGGVLCEYRYVEDDVTGVICEEENALTKLISGQACGAFS